MNRLLNRAQWEKSNDPDYIRIKLVLVEILEVEWLTPIEIAKSIYKIIHISINIRDNIIDE